VSIARDGALLPEVRAVVASIARHKLVLATGHSSPEEDLLLVAEARRAGVQQVVVTHPMVPPVNMSIAQMKQAAAGGAYLEFTYLGLIPPVRSTIEDYAAAMRAVGVEHCVITSDLGRAGDPLHPDGLVLFIRALLKQGFSQADIDRMAKTNPSRVLGL
jgi:microsomal dipeptidase-like Zn-dependent dipeptidase